MEEEKGIEWFKREIAPQLKGYELSYKFFEEGDFGSLHQIEFNSERMGGNIDFWGLGWLGVFIWNYETDEEVLNVLLRPEQGDEKDKVVKQMLEVIK
jgi:hypothetical protein